MVSRPWALCLLALLSLENPFRVLASADAVNWRVWNTADGMIESFISQITRTPSGAIIARHGDVPDLTLIDGLRSQPIPDTHSLGLVYQNVKGDLYTFDKSGILIYSGARWTQYPLPELSQFATPKIFDHFRWFEYPLSPDRSPRLDAVPASGDRAIILAPERLLLWSKSEGRARIMLAANDAGIGPFAQIVPVGSSEFLVAGGSGIGLLNEDGHWTRISTPPGLTRFWSPSRSDDGAILVSAVRTPKSRSLLLGSSVGWKEIYRGGSDLRGFQASGRIWILDDNRLLTYEQGAVSAVELPREITGHFTDAASDGKTFWLGTTQGLARYAPGLWQAPSGAPEFSGIVNAIAQDRDGRIWFGAGSDMFSYFQGVWQRHALPPGDQQGAGKTGAISPMDDGSILLSTASTSHLLRFWPERGVFEPIVHPDHRRIVWTDRRDGRSIWVETMQAGDDSSSLEIYDGAFHQVPGADALPVVDMRAVLEAKDGSIWVGGTGTLMRIVGGQVRYFTGPQAPPEQSGFALAADENGTIYVGHRDSVSTFDGNRFRILRNGLDRARRIVFGPDRNLWIAAGTGVYRVRDGNWIENGAEEGLPSAAAYTVFVDRSGAVWAGTTRGLSRYYPETDRDPPVTLIPEYRNMTHTPPGGEVHLSFFGKDRWKQTSSERLLFSWRLDGSPWSSFDSPQMITLRNLQSGQHNFEVRAMDRNGNLDPNPPQFRFSVMQPWYRETGFYVVAFLLAAALGTLTRSVYRRQRELHYQSRHDSLTGLANRRQFEDALMAAVEQHESTAAVLLIDLDGFKGVNDLYGHLAGDKLLISIASRLSGCIGKDDVLARLGGDEFAILIADANERSAVSELADRIRQAVRDASAPQSRGVSASIGISFFPQDATSSFVLMRLADIAMYHSKSIKGDCWFFYEPSMKLDFRYAEMAGVVRSALREERVVVFYQPIVNRQGRIARLEALVRIHDPAYGIIAPSLFVPVAERTGMINALGARALREALSAVARWWQEGSMVPVAVNISPIQLDRSVLVDEILDALRIAGLPPQALTIEITESAIAHSRSQALEILQALRSAGVRISLDDFGTGYSSLSALNGFPIDEIKLDRSFISSIQSPRTREVILQTVQLARNLGIEIVLEGIEEEDQKAIALELGCDLLQGFLIAPPLQFEDATAFVLGEEGALITVSDREGRRLY